MPFEISLPEIPGDPAGMRRLADELKEDVGKITAVAGHLSSSAGSMTFDGPAGDRFRHRTQTATNHLASYAERLTAVASKLKDAADEVERQQRERLRKIEEMRREYASQGVAVRVLS